MTPDEKRARDRERMRRYRRTAAAKAAHKRYVERNRDRIDFRKFVWRDANRERRAAVLKAWKLATGYKTPPKARTEARLLLERRRNRREYLAKAKDPAALARRIAAHLESIVPRTLPAEARTAVIAALAEAVYTGELSTRPRPEDVKPYIAAHFRMFTNFGPISLDAARFDDGRGSLHDTISEGMWA